jgi:hypothetical protein
MGYCGGENFYLPLLNRTKTDNVMINTELLRSEYAKVYDKLSEIAKLNCTKNETFEGIDFDESDDYIVYRTSEWRGGGYEYNSFSVKWEDINKPMSYFEEKKRREKEAEVIRLAEKEAAEQERKEKAEKAKLEELLRKYGKEFS